MNLTLLFLLGFVVWSTLHVFAAQDLELSTNSTSPVYDHQFTFICTFTGDNFTLGFPIKFVRTNKTICKRHAYKTNTQTERQFACAKYYNTTDAYMCECDAVYPNKKVYSITIKSFKAIDATKWSCISVNTNDVMRHNSNVVDLSEKVTSSPASVTRDINRSTISAVKIASSSESVTYAVNTTTASALVNNLRSNPVLIPAVSVASGAVIVLVIIVVTVYIIKKRRNSRQHGTTDIKNDGQNYAERNNRQERKEPVMKDNELYFMSRDSSKHRRKPVMIDNDIYNLGNEDEELHVKPEDVGIICTQSYNKGGKAKGDPLQKLTDEEISAMYAVVKKDTKSVADTKSKDRRTNEKREDNELAEDMSDIYTQVNKNKTKN
ncbi:uncharacterized protein LOC121386638 isoform X2 [Gigantopelta aegis]|uniref:uncharacterized protein LOC121386638 isoform X2 n=1 Tax=Gigantopelta aegis TaxID=1735272 RepID=UPI001B88D000|nr:uncharacterized protein LOC121386638 isoform X2 [Gigantopelta aegis]